MSSNENPIPSGDNDKAICPNCGSDRNIELSSTPATCSTLDPVSEESELSVVKIVVDLQCLNCGEERQVSF